MAYPINQSQVNFVEHVIKHQGIPVWIKVALVAVAMIWHQIPDPIIGQIDDMLMYVPALVALSTKANVWMLKKRTQWTEWRQRRKEQKVQRKLVHDGMR